jgi:UDP-N-acetylglucosamine diphosphorylase / glucose-1-phosphate thymidylyltransferase / UDP-N-acetylgalactosamine diphosphorylase / glucosamine-1-phosphate N-acetyltransferase / galactosamine-1-phosphate N-acetyltransferase
MNYVLFDSLEARKALLPLTFTRPVSEIRIGIQTITEKWADCLQSPISFATEDYLQAKYPMNLVEDNIFINGSFCPTDELVEVVKSLPPKTILITKSEIIAYRYSEYDPTVDVFESSINFEGNCLTIKQLTDIFVHNGEQIKADFERITKNRTSQPIRDKFTAYYNESQIFIEEGVDIKACVLDASQGCIYIGKNVRIQAGAMIQGPFAIGENSVINMGAKMRPNTTIGPFCKVGGEISNSVMFGNANKGHEGFMGNAVIGEWCNWGADTNNSNLKNDYSKVDLWSYETNKFENTGIQFAGLIMGDHSKCGINTMFNTGTVVGVNCNIFGADFQPRHIPSFSWSAGNGEFKTYHLRKANQVAKTVFERRAKVFDEVEEGIMKAVFDLTRG